MNLLYLCITEKTRNKTFFRIIYFILTIFLKFAIIDFRIKIINYNLNYFNY